MDIFPAGYGDVFDRNIAASGRAKRVVKKTGLSSQVLRSLKRNSYDFIYVDGCHEAACVYLDAALSWDLLKVGGTLIFDDYVWELGKPAQGRPKLAIDAFVESFAPFIDVLQTNNHSLILRKTRDSLAAEGRFGRLSGHVEKRSEAREVKSAGGIGWPPTSESTGGLV